MTPHDTRNADTTLAPASSSPESLEAIRRDYARAVLDEQHVASDPLVQCRRWFDDAVGAGSLDPNAVTIATVGLDGAPAARVVLIRIIDDRGLCFFTSYESRKGRELRASPRAALVAYWPDLERQLRVEGNVERTSEAESDRYFAGRPVDSQLAAWASEQSRAIDSRASLEHAFAQMRRRFPDAVPRPPSWGGFRLVPALVELWQGRPSRLHDRLRYRRLAEGWTIERLAP